MFIWRYCFKKHSHQRLDCTGAFHSDVPFAPHMLARRYAENARNEAQDTRCESSFFQLTLMGVLPKFGLRVNPINMAFRESQTVHLQHHTYHSPQVIEEVLECSK